MAILRPLMPILLTLSLAAWSLTGCFVRAPEPIGGAEPAAAGEWSGGWVAEPQQAGGEPGFFVVTDVDPAQGMFAVSEADGDGNAIEEPIALHLRRVGDARFLATREQEGTAWMLFVVAEMTPDRVMLAWKPRAEAFRQALDSGVLAGRIAASAGDTPPDIDLADFTPVRQEKFAQDWWSLFTAERLVLRRMPVGE